jgi:phosphohistidine phosphatase
VSTGLKPASWYRQSGVVALRLRDGKPQVLLVTSARGKRWVIPKGIVEEGHTPAASAAKEAWEEAGIRGAVSRRRIGRYVYEKWGGFCTVGVYLMRVTGVAREWPEAHVRRRRWFAPARAAALLDEPVLREILLAAATAARARGGSGR